MQEKCAIDPERGCIGLQRADEIASDIKTLSQRVDDFKQSVSETHTRFGSRIGELEAHDKVMNEKHNYINEKLENITRDMSDFKRENKDSISELRKEHKESMAELKKGNQEILDAITPMKHDVEDLKRLEADVDNLKSKPAKTWESIKSQALGWIVALVLVIVAVALGLGKYL